MLNCSILAVHMHVYLHFSSNILNNGRWLELSISFDASSNDDISENDK